MKKPKLNWWHISGIDGSEIVQSEDLPYRDVAWFGPFNTFSECKRDAIDYHMADVRTARMAIGDLRTLKKPKLERAI